MPFSCTFHKNAMRFLRDKCPVDVKLTSSPVAMMRWYIYKPLISCLTKRPVSVSSAIWRLYVTIIPNMLSVLTSGRAAAVSTASITCIWQTSLGFDISLTFNQPFPSRDYENMPAIDCIFCTNYAFYRRHKNYLR